MDKIILGMLTNFLASEHGADIMNMLKTLVSEFSETRKNTDEILRILRDLNADLAHDLNLENIDD